MARCMISPGSRICIRAAFQSSLTKESVRIVHTPTLLWLSDPSTAGQDATEAFYALHRHEVIQRPQYARLQIGTVKGEESVIVSRVTGQLSKVPYAEPTWLSDGYYSPYYKEVSKAHMSSTRRGR